MYVQRHTQNTLSCFIKHSFVLFYGTVVTVWYSILSPNLWSYYEIIKSVRRQRPRFQSEGCNMGGMNKMTISSRYELFAYAKSFRLLSFGHFHNLPFSYVCVMATKYKYISVSQGESTAILLDVCNSFNVISLFLYISRTHSENIFTSHTMSVSLLFRKKFCGDIHFWCAAGNIFIFSPQIVCALNFHCTAMLLD